MNMVKTSILSHVIIMLLCKPQNHNLSARVRKMDPGL